jgi:long-subunit fatty acid transport protein
VHGLGPAAFPRTRFHSSIKFPPQLILGVSTKAIPRWTTNADIEWEGWQTVDSIPKTFEGKRAIDASSFDPTLTGLTGGPPVFGSFSTAALGLMLSVTHRF